MQKPQEIKVLTFGEKSFPVESFSAEIQVLVGHYNTINQKEAELRSDLFTLQAAKKQIERDIESTYVREQQELANKDLQESSGGDANTVSEQDSAPASDAK